MKCNHCYKMVSRKDNVCPYCGKEITKKRINYKDICIVILVIVLGSLSTSLRWIDQIKSKQDLRKYSEEYSAYDFNDIIENNLDENNTVKNILEKQGELKAFLNSNGYSIIDKKEHVMKTYKKDPLYARGYLTFSKDQNIKYTIAYEYERGRLTETELEISYSKDVKDKDVFNVQEDKIKALEQYIEIDNIYSLMKEKYPFMKQNENYKERYEVISHEKYSIFLTEYINDNNIECNYSIRNEIN